jgi:TPR repeat protein
VKWIRLAAAQGHALAQCDLGVCYENGIGVIKDTAEAEKWFRREVLQRQVNAIKEFNNL